MTFTTAVTTTLFLTATPPSAVAQESIPPEPGQRDFYVGNVSLFTSPGPPEGSTPRLGVARLQIGDGLLSGRFIFPADDSNVVAQAECQGSIDMATGRGLLKVRWVDPNTPSLDALPTPTEKMSVLLKRGVLTGGTMGSDGGVLAFRLERAFVILP